MKTNILLTLAAFAIAGNMAHAQLTYGPKAGINYSIVTTNFKEGEKPDDWENESGIGFHVGGFVNYAISDKISIRPELMYSARSLQQSSTFEVAGITTETDGSATYNYIEVPILVGIGGETGLQIHVGPSVNLLLGGKAKGDSSVTIGGVTTTESFEVSGSEFTEGTRGLDLGAVIGVGFNTEGGIGFGARYQRGLTSINDEDTDIAVSNWNVIQVYAAYTLGK